MNDVSSDIQKLNFAGIFYPSDPDELKALISDAIDAAPRAFPKSPKFVIAPHSGFQYTSKTIAAAFREISNPRVNRVVILTPSHRTQFEGVAAPASKKFETPIGNLKLARKAFRMAMRLKFVDVNEEVFNKEHGAETLLPWIKHQLPDAGILPLVIGRTSEEDLLQLIQTVWGNVTTIFVISTDLSHFLTRSEAVQADKKTAQSIERMDDTNLQLANACGANILRPFLQNVREKSMRITRTALTTSFEQTHDDTRVVGYGSWVGHAQPFSKFLNADQTTLYQACGRAIQSNFSTKRNQRIYETIDEPRLNSFLSCFVTLKIDDQLRGSMGNLTASTPLYQAVQEGAIRAAFEDTRFDPLAKENFDKVEAEISLLTHPIDMQFDSRDEVVDRLSEQNLGVILMFGSRRATFLPTLWNDCSDPDQFIKALLEKAGLPDSFWSIDLKIQTYRAELFDKVSLKDTI